MRKNVFVIGAGSFGRSIAKILNKNNENVIVIDKDKNALYKLDEFSGFTQVLDSTDLDGLEELGIRNSKCVVITTNDDNLNLYLADVVLNIFDITNIYIRLTDNEKTKLISSECIHPICPFSLSIEKFNTIYEVE